MKLLLVDDHPVVRAGVRRLLAELTSDLKEAATADEAMDAFRREPPDVVVLDINLPDASGFDVLTRMLAADEKARVIMFSMHSDPLYANRALSIGARGYVGKNAAADELMVAVKRVMEGGRYIDRDIASQLAFAMEDGKDPLEKLSPREAEIMRHLGAGYSIAEIARTMGIAYKTVANTCGVIKSKLGVTRTSELIRIAIGLRRD